jgi:exodeoxyribonuclease VII large subunit
LLQALGPGSILKRGFSVAFGPDGGVLKSIAEVSPGDDVTVRVSDGEFRAKVEE